MKSQAKSCKMDSAEQFQYTEFGCSALVISVSVTRFVNNISLRYAVKILRFLVLMALLISPQILTLAAGGCPDGTGGNDNITCSVSPPTAGNTDNQIDTGLGDDTIVQAAGVTTLDIDAD